MEPTQDKLQHLGFASAMTFGSLVPTNSLTANTELAKAPPAATLSEGTRAALCVIKKKRPEGALPKDWTVRSSRSKPGKHWYSHTSGLKTWKRPKAHEGKTWQGGLCAVCGASKGSCLCKPTHLQLTSAPVSKYAVLGRKRPKYRSVKSAQEQLESDAQYEQLATLFEEL